MQSPLWIIHLGGKFPRAYDDAILQATQNSNGGVASNIATVIKCIATEKASGLSVIDGYSWTVEKSNSETSTNNSIEPIAARQLVLNLSKQSQHQLSLQELDTIHQVAKNYDIFTPYSSMIVLVNDQQREHLKKAEAKTDRFDTEVENGVEQLDKPFNPFEVSGTPEPDLWLSLSLVAIALFLVFQRQRVIKIPD